MKFEEKKGRQENKKFHKALKSFTQQKRHQEKKQNIVAIDTLKEKIKSGDNIGDKEFNSIMMAQGSKSGQDHKKGDKPQKKATAIDQIKGNKAPEK